MGVKYTIRIFIPCKVEASIFDNKEIQPDLKRVSKN